MTDPRYDEQFRRGYAGPPVQPPVDAGASASEPDAPERLQGDDPGSPAPAGEDRVVGESSRVQPADADRRDIGGARPFRRNPFAISLLAVGVLMLIVGVWMVQRSISLTSIVYTPEQQAVIQAEAQLAAPLLTGGVIAIVAWLVLGAFAVSAARRVDS
jgi:hypothetical protein